jgi:hypothetical protein
MTVIIIVPNQCPDLGSGWSRGDLTLGRLDANEGGAYGGRVPIRDCKLFTATLSGCDARHFL